MPAFIGGAELNVATALARWGVPVSYVTALPDHHLSHEICKSLYEKKINTEGILFSGERVACYYLPQGGDLKHGGVIYDRAHSSFSEIRVGQLDWNTLLKNKSWFHFSAISPALNQNVADVCLEGLVAAKKLGLTISIDLNYRKKLWQYGKLPKEVMPTLVEHCHVVMGNLWAMREILGISFQEDLCRDKAAYLEQAKDVSMAIQEKYKTCRQVANTFRFEKENEVQYYATLFDHNQLFVSNEQVGRDIVDKVGTGDCFMAGLIYGNLKKWGASSTVNFAASAAFQKLYIEGDATTKSVEEILNNRIHYG